MNVTCPSCSTVYRVDPGKVPAKGVRARCRVCAAIFQVPAPGEAPERVPAMSREAPAPRPTYAPPPPAPAPAPAPPEPVAAPTPQPVRATPPEPALPSQPPRVTAPRGTTQPSRPSVAIPPVVPPAARASVLGLGRPPAAVPPASQPPPAAAPPAPAAPPAARRPVNPFMAQDPQAKAKRLARALISDLVVYYPDRRADALRKGTLQDVFSEEIKKSWEEYRDQVGKEIAESTPYFNDALNDILAGGQKLF